MLRRINAKEDSKYAQKANSNFFFCLIWLTPNQIWISTLYGHGVAEWNQLGDSAVTVTATDKTGKF